MERNVVENERRLRSENGHPFEVFERLNRALYGASYFGKPVGGTAASLSRLTLADAVEFARLHYRPEHMTLLVAGGPPSDTEALARAFGELQREGTGASPPNRSLPQVVASKLVPTERATAVVGAPELWLAWRLPGGFAGERAKLEVIEDMAEGSLVSVTADRRDVGSVTAFVDYGPRVSTLYCRATLSATDDVEGVRLAHALDRGIAQSALDADWRTIFTRDRATRRMLEFEPISLRAREMALGAHYAENPSFAIEQTTAIESLTADELNDVADRYLTLEQSRALLLEPGGATSLAELSHEVKHAGTGDGSEGTSPASAAEERSEPQLEDSEFVTETLENGLEVISIGRTGDRYYTALLGFLDGQARQPLAVARAARWAMNYLVKPPAGIDFSSALGVDSVAWVALERVGARSRARALDRALHEHRAELEVSVRELMRSLLGDSVLTSLRPSDFDSVRVQDIRKWRDSVYRPENAYLVIAGPHPDGAIASARTHLSSWKRSVARAPRVAAPALPPVRAGGLSLALVSEPGLSQTVLRLGCRLPRHSAETVAAEEVLAERIEHYLEGALRESTGSTFYVDVDVDRVRGGLSVLRISAAVADAQLEEAIAPLLGWLESPAPFDETAVVASRHTLMTRFVFEVSTTSGLAERVFEQRRLGFEPELYSAYSKRLAAVRADSLAPLVSACRKNAVLAAAGNVDEVERLAAPFVARLR